MINKELIRYTRFGFFFGLILAGIAIIGSLIDPGVITFQESVYGALIIFIPIGVFCGFLYFWYEQVYAPKKKKKILNHTSLKPFIDLGFKKNETFLEGTYRDFECKIWWMEYSPINSNRSSINISVNHREVKNDITELNKKYNKENIMWEKEEVLGFNEILFKLPKHEKIRRSIDRIIDAIKDNNNLK